MNPRSLTPHARLFLSQRTSSDTGPLPPCTSVFILWSELQSTWLIYLELTDTGFSSRSSFPKSTSSIPITGCFQPSPGERSHLQDLPSADCPPSCLIHRRLLLRLRTSTSYFPAAVLPPGQDQTDRCPPDLQRQEAGSPASSHSTALGPPRRGLRRGPPG